jgi:WD40 repeat protein
VAAPEIESRVELQVWCLATRRRVAALKGHLAFTTKDCPFLLFTHDDATSPLNRQTGPPAARTCHEPRDACGNGNRPAAGCGSGDLVCSGSEDAAAYVWSLSLRRLVKVLRGHGDVVSAVGWSPRVPGLLATASDDHTVRLWGRTTTQVKLG